MALGLSQPETQALALRAMMFGPRGDEWHQMGADRIADTEREPLYASRPPVPEANPREHLVNVTAQYVPVEEAEGYMAGLRNVEAQLQVVTDRLRALTDAVTADLARPLDEHVTRRLADELESSRQFLREADNA